MASAVASWRNRWSSTRTTSLTTSRQRLSGCGSACAEPWSGSGAGAERLLSAVLISRAGLCRQAPELPVVDAAGHVDRVETTRVQPADRLAAASAALAVDDEAPAFRQLLHPAAELLQRYQLRSGDAGFLELLWPAHVKQVRACLELVPGLACVNGRYSLKVHQLPPVPRLSIWATAAPA